MIVRGEYLFDERTTRENCAIGNEWYEENEKVVNSELQKLQRWYSGEN